MSRIPVYTLANSAQDAHLFYTGFTWPEIEEIFKAIKASSKRPLSANTYDDAFFDHPSYAGLPRRITKRITMDQVDYFNFELPTTIKEVAKLLARGKT